MYDKLLNEVANIRFWDPIRILCLVKYLELIELWLDVDQITGMKRDMF